MLISPGVYRSKAYLIKVLPESLDGRPQSGPSIRFEGGTRLRAVVLVEGGRGRLVVWSGRWLGIYEITAPPDLHLVVTVVCSVTVQ